MARVARFSAPAPAQVPVEASVPAQVSVEAPAPAPARAPASVGQMREADAPAHRHAWERGSDTRHGGAGHGGMGTLTSKLLRAQL